MWFALALFTLVTFVNASIDIPQCPIGCKCHAYVTSSALTVDCAQRPPAVDVKQLSNELDTVILSADHVISHLSLTLLSITNTPLTHIPASVCKLVNLTSLNLNDNNLTEVRDNCFTKLTKLITLSVSRNAIVGLQDGIFDGMQSLVTLDLSYNLISFIGLRVFSNSSDLTSLRLLNLAWNRLTSLEPWWYYRCILGNETSPVKVLLKRNLISNFTNKLQFKFRCGMKLPYGKLCLNENRIAHIMDAFNGWNMVGSSIFTTIACLINMKGKYPLMNFDIGGSRYVCDCTDFELYKIAQLFAHTRIMDRVRCGTLNFRNIFGQKMLATKIPLKEFVCELTDRCPSGCQCVYRPANFTLHVYCSAANLSSLPLDLPPLPKKNVKYKLDFSNNKLLRRLEHRPYFVNTSILDVSNCSLIDIALGDLRDVRCLSVVNLRGNQIQSFPGQANTVNISATLLIGGNPWRCSCDNSWMIGWLQSLSGQISDPGDITCASPAQMYGRNILKSTVEDFCVDPVKSASKSYIITIIISLSSAVATAVLLIVFRMLLYKFRVKLYTKWNFHPFDRDECHGEDMDYDVFLCCSSVDYDPHGRHILELIESKGYRVCYHEYDFPPGLILENMGQAIERSKRTVCLVSTNFRMR